MEARYEKLGAWIRQASFWCLSSASSAPPLCGEEKLEPTQATAWNIGFCNIKRRWEDISDSEEFPFAPQADFFFIGDSENDEKEDFDVDAAFSQAHVSTQTDFPPLLRFVDAPTSDNDVSLPRILCLDLLCVPAPTAQNLFLSSGVTEERNAALLSELRELNILVESMRADADCMRAGFKAELKEVVDKLSFESLSETCLSPEAAVTVKCLVSTLEPSLEADSEGTGGTDRAPIFQGDGYLQEDSIASVVSDTEYGDSAVDEVYLNLQALKVFCFPRPQSFAWNTNDRKSLIPLPEDPYEGTSDRAMFALPCVEFYTELLMHVEANHEDNICTVFDNSGDCSHANLRLAHNRLKACKCTNVRDCDDPKPVLCKIMNLVEFLLQNYLKNFTECLHYDLEYMQEIDIVSLELVYSNQVRMKRYSFLRSDLFESDGDYNDYACFSSFSACSASGHDDQSCNEFFSRAFSQNVGIGRLASD